MMSLLLLKNIPDFFNKDYANFMPRSSCTSHQETAHAKINLFLHVTGRRADGYHLLDSLAVFSEAQDILTLHSTPEIMSHNPVTLEITGPFGDGLEADTSNLVMRAALMLRDRLNKHVPAPARLSLEKNLPLASGIGGGSADAAAALRLLGRVWGIEHHILAEIAPRLGADVPVCLAQKPMRMEGVGEILSPAPALPDLGILLVNPGIGVSTPAIFTRLAETDRIGQRPELALPLEGWKTSGALISFLRDKTGNDLQASAIAEEPIIAEVLHSLKNLPGAELVQMSGSGATCFALFNTAEDARAGERFLKTKPEARNWWSHAGSVRP